jgi:5-methylcytosine-specific restriction endonuclease McrA
MITGMGYTGEWKNEYQRKWLSNRRLRGIELLGGVCIRCGSTEKLEFDHVDPSSKDPSLREGKTRQGFPWSWSWQRVEVELRKCQLLCSDCHQIKTNQDMPLQTQGEKHYRSTLTEDNVRLIRQSSDSYSQLAKRFNVNKSAVAKIKQGKNWKHVV